MAIAADQEYELEQQKNKWMKRAEFAFVQFLRLIVYFIKLFLKIIWGIIKTLLQTFGFPIR